MIATSQRIASNLLSLEDFREAAAALGECWPGVAVAPARGDLGDVEYAHLLMVCAVLTLSLGTQRQIAVQAFAKDMLSTSIRLFGDAPEGQEARLWLGVAYLKCGEYQEVIAYCDVLLADNANVDVVVSAALTRAMAETELGKYEASLDSLASVSMLLEAVPKLVQGKFYLNRGRAFRALKLLDNAKDDYDQATELFEEINAARWEAAATNNCAGVFTDLGDFSRAHVYVERAITLFQRVKDRAMEAKAWDQSAQIYLKEENYRYAANHANKAVLLLSEGDQDGWLAEALTTHGIALAQLGIEGSVKQLTKAAELALKIGSTKQAEDAYRELWKTSRQIRSLAGEVADSVRPIERVVIEHVLIKHEGKITPTAAELGIKHNAIKKKLAQFPELLIHRRPPHRRAKPHK